MMPTLKPQVVPFDDPASVWRFVPAADLPLLATPAALALYGDVIPECLTNLQALAAIHSGIDYLQVFTDSEKVEALWFIEDGPGGAITALLPSDH